MTWSRRTWVVTTLVVALSVLLGIFFCTDCLRLARTPGEVIDYAKRRLQGHPRLEWMALPLLDAMVDLLDEPSAIDRARPFVVPALAAAVAGTAASGPAASGDPLRILVGPTRSVTSLAMAARVAPDGAVVEVDPGDYVGDVAVWLQRKLTIRGMGSGVRLIAGGRSAEDKAIWVIRRGNFVVENIEFIGARVDDKNGAGIRFEGGELIVRRCRFYDNQDGILAGGGAGTRLVVEGSEFAYNGAGDGQSHGIYVLDIDSFRLTGSYFHHANVGHLVKSRARKNRIEYNRLTDELGGRASYELEFPDGGDAEVVGNIIQQGSGTENSVMVSFGAESYRWPVNRLAMAHNTLVNDRRYGGTFVRVSSGAQALILINNLWVGPGRVNLPSFAELSGNRFTDWSAFVKASRFDYRLTTKAHSEMLESQLQAPPQALNPAFEYEHPMRVRPVPTLQRVPGALQLGPP